jgi:hypothetical protein
VNCAYCQEPLDGPLPMHPECSFRAVGGSVAHIEQRCSCFVPGSAEGDPPGLTLREGAHAAVEAFHKMRTEQKGPYGRHLRN